MIIKVFGGFFGFFGCFALLYGACFPAANAQIPQNTLPGASEATYKTINAQQVNSMLSGMGVQTQITPSSTGGSPSILAQSPNGGRFYVDLFACDDDAKLIGCNGMLLRAALSNTGASYDDLNRFNSVAVVTTAVNIAERNLLFFGRYAIITGGVGVAQLQVQTALFLNDVDTYLSSQGNATSVSLETGDNRVELPGSKISGLGVSTPSATSNRRILVDEALVDSAIFNTFSVRFLTKQAKSLIQNLE